MGEIIPFALVRVEDFVGPTATHLERTISEYFLQNFFITTSGYFTYPPLMCALSVIGADRILFSVDYPYSPNEAGRAFLDSAPISPPDKEKLAYLNAEKLLRL